MWITRKNVKSNRLFYTYLIYFILKVSPSFSDEPTNQPPSKIPTNQPPSSSPQSQSQEILTEPQSKEPATQQSQSSETPQPLHPSSGISPLPPSTNTDPDPLDDFLTDPSSYEESKDPLNIGDDDEQENEPNYPLKTPFIGPLPNPTGQGKSN